MEIEVVGVKYEIDEWVRKYAEKRIGKLAKYLKRSVKKEATATVKVSQVNRAHGNKYEIFAEIKGPGMKKVVAKDEGGNVYAGIDVIEAKLAEQMRKEK